MYFEKTPSNWRLRKEVLERIAAIYSTFPFGGTNRIRFKGYVSVLFLEHP